ncbi:ribonuclease domain-containing protein [Kitasatospora sp. NPDC054939]
MSSPSGRNRLIVIVATLLCGVAAALAYGLAGSGADPGPEAGPSPASSPTPASAAASASRPASAPASAATGWTPSDPGLADVCRTRLPAQADRTLVLIAQGGPYPYRADGTVFQNRENRLPRRASGYYREYTVTTPGATDRGARRIVTGGAGEQYWTADHYTTFEEIDARC